MTKLIENSEGETEQKKMRKHSLYESWISDLDAHFNHVGNL